jgi:hypothetical protein
MSAHLDDNRVGYPRVDSFLDGSRCGGRAQQALGVGSHRAGNRVELLLEPESKETVRFVKHEVRHGAEVGVARSHNVNQSTCRKWLDGWMDGGSGARVRV